MRDTVSGQTTEGVSHPPDFPVHKEVVLIETVLHVTEELSLRLHKSDSSKTMRPATRLVQSSKNIVLVVSQLPGKALVEL